MEIFVIEWNKILWFWCSISMNFVFLYDNIVFFDIIFYIDFLYFCVKILVFLGFL